MVLLQLHLDLDLGVGERFVEIVCLRRRRKGVMGHFDDNFHLVAVFFLIDDDLTSENAFKIVFELGAGLGDVFFGFFGDLAAVARADPGLYSLLLSHGENFRMILSVVIF